MILFAALALLVASVPLSGGRLSRLGELRLRAMALLVAGLGLQVLTISIAPAALPPAVAAGTHVLSYGLVLAFVWRNRRVTGLPLMGVGGLLNLAPIAVNGGVMPASPDALATAGRVGQAWGDAGFLNSGVVPDARLGLLGDVWALPAHLPLANVFSLGDVLLVIGAAFVLHACTGSRLARGSRSPVRAEAAEPVQHRG